MIGMGVWDLGFGVGFSDVHLIGFGARLQCNMTVMRDSTCSSKYLKMENFWAHGAVEFEGAMTGSLTCSVSERA